MDGIPNYDKLYYIKLRLEQLEYERHGTTREDIAWLVAEVERLRARVKASCERP